MRVVEPQRDMDARVGPGPWTASRLCSGLVLTRASRNWSGGATRVMAGFSSVNCLVCEDVERTRSHHQDEQAQCMLCAFRPYCCADPHGVQRRSELAAGHGVSFGCAFVIRILYKRYFQASPSNSV